MAELTEYEVLRRHDGDKLYDVGDTRKALSNEVAHLVGNTLRKKTAKAAAKK